MPTESALLRVYETGPVLTVGFGSEELTESDLLDVRDELLDLVRLHACEAIVFELHELRHVPSSLLSVFLMLRRKGVQVHLFNPSTELLEVLRITHLDQFFKIGDVAARGESTELAETVSWTAAN